MANMQKHKNPMPSQDPALRRRNFQEVALGYTDEQAKSEAERCLQCKNRPCVNGCPVNVQIPEFIALIQAGDVMGAYEKIRETNALPAICGRVCPQETQCEATCVRGIKGEPVAIGRLERFAADRAMACAKPAQLAPRRGKRVAVVGSGPAGLVCAGDLAKRGVDVTIFEALHTPGGVLVYGIPEFRLPNALVREEIRTVEALGVDIQTDMVVGRVFTLDELLETLGYSAVFVGSGAGLPGFLHIPGENLNGVYSANEFLTRVNLMKAYDPQADTPIFVGRRVAVVGGGNVAMDAARCAKRMGAEEVYIVYRRSEVELPARLEEVHHAKEEGIIFKLLTNPTRILGDEKGWVSGMECVDMTLGEPDDSGRRRPVAMAGSERVTPLESVIVAVGTSPNPLIKQTTSGLETNKYGCLIADEWGQTSKKGVFAGGDAVTGAATVILAMGAGKKAAEAILKYIQNS